MLKAFHYYSIYNYNNIELTCAYLLKASISVRMCAYMQLYCLCRCNTQLFYVLCKDKEIYQIFMYFIKLFTMCSE